MHAIAYNYPWSREYILTAVSMAYGRELLDDALLFNPWVSKPKEPEAIPEGIRKEIMEKRKQWEEENANGVNA